MILQTLLALCLVSVVLGDGCCTPKRWEGTQYVAGGFSRGRKRGGFVNAFDISYDAERKKIAVSGRYRKMDREDRFKVIYDFGASVGYYMLPDKETCKSFEMKRKFREACIPDEARELGSTFLGAGENTLDVTSYAMHFKRNTTDIGAIATVTKEGCIPVSENVAGSFKRVEFFENVNFAGITPGIKDETVFSPPEYCEQQTVDMIDEEFYEKYSLLQFSHPGVAQNPF